MASTDVITRKSIASTERDFVKYPDPDSMFISFKNTVRGVKSIKIKNMEMAHTRDLITPGNNTLYFSEYDSTTGLYSSFQATIPISSYVAGELAETLQSAMWSATLLKGNKSVQNRYTCTIDAAEGGIRSLGQQAFSLHLFRSELEASHVEKVSNTSIIVTLRISQYPNPYQPGAMVKIQYHKEGSATTFAEQQCQVQSLPAAYKIQLLGTFDDLEAPAAADFSLADADTCIINPLSAGTTLGQFFGFGDIDLQNGRETPIIGMEHPFHSKSKNHITITGANLAIMDSLADFPGVTSAQVTFDKYVDVLFQLDDEHMFKVGDRIYISAEDYWFHGSYGVVSTLSHSTAARIYIPLYGFTLMSGATGNISGATSGQTAVFTNMNLSTFAAGTVTLEATLNGGEDGTLFSVGEVITVTGMNASEYTNGTMAMVLTAKASGLLTFTSFVTAGNPTTVVKKWKARYVGQHNLLGQNNNSTGMLYRSKLSVDYTVNRRMIFIKAYLDETKQKAIGNITMSTSTEVYWARGQLYGGPAQLQWFNEDRMVSDYNFPDKLSEMTGIYLVFHDEKQRAYNFKGVEWTLLLEFHSDPDASSL